MHVQQACCAELKGQTTLQGDYLICGEENASYLCDKQCRQVRPLRWAAHGALQGRPQARVCSLACELIVRKYRIIQVNGQSYYSDLIYLRDIRL